MSERRKVLELFEKHKEYIDAKIQRGIEENRKGYAQLTITDQSGKPVQNATVKIKQKSHEFRFGINLFMLDEMESKEKNEAYKKAIADTFNMATLPFYWDATEPEKGKTRYTKDASPLYRRPPIDRCIEYCEKNGIEPREHALAYDHFFPTWLYDASVAEIKTALEKRYREISERYADKIPTIEVTNEMEWKKRTTAFYDEPDFVEFCFKLAEKYFPANELVINEHTAACWADRCRPSDKYYSYIKAAMLAGARIDAIGMQYHQFKKKEVEYEETRVTYDPLQLYAHMDLYATLGRPLQITEVTIPAYSNDAEDEAIQAEIIKTLYSIWFSHPNVEQIIYWNAVDGYAHVPNPNPEKIRATQGNMEVGENYYYGGLFRFDMTAKPAYHLLHDLIHKEWHTEETKCTDANGETQFSGFFGKYDVEIEADGKVYHKQIDLQKKSKHTFNIIL